MNTKETLKEVTTTLMMNNVLNESGIKIPTNVLGIRLIHHQ